jgi:hypothetical protein
MKRAASVSGIWWVALMAAGILCTGVPPAAAAGDSFACVAEDKLEKDIAPGAELAELSCTFDRYEGEEVLHVKVGVKNTGEKDQRFRVNLFFDNGKAVGGLLPRQTKKGLVKPGEVASFVYPVVAMKDKPAAMTLKVSAAGE